MAADVAKVLRQICIRLLSTLISLLFVIYLLVMRLIKGKEYFRNPHRPTPPPLVTDPKWGTHCYMNLKSQGVRLHYVEKGNKSNPLILCLHGFPECWFSWRNQLEHLSDKYWVVAVDMRGYADSDKPSDKSAYAITHLVEDIRKFILALGKEKCIIMAHDWGAVIAWELVMKYPELFDHHISCNGPHPGAFRKLLHSSWKQKCMSWYIVFFQTPWVPELLFGADDFGALDNGFGGKQNTPDIIEVYKYYLSQEGALTPIINYYRNRDFAAVPETYPKVTVPTLIIWGTDDPALGKELATLGGEECENADVKFVEGAEHWVPQEQPELMNKMVLEYLAPNQSESIDSGEN